MDLQRMLSLLLLLSGTEVQCQETYTKSCPIPDSDIQKRLMPSIYEGLFLNFGAPIQCNGTVKSWHYCSYHMCENREMYSSTFMVYRLSGPSTYVLVPESKRPINITRNCPSPKEFQCHEEILLPDEQFRIQQNDIVAVCMMQTISTAPVRIIGEERPRSSLRNQVYEIGDFSFQECKSSQLDMVNTRQSVLTLYDNYRLHLHAEIRGPVARAQCSGGSNPPPFTPSVVSGTYLNTVSPVNCTDTITSWHYCYYPSAAANSQLTYTATVGVWRLNAAMNQYELLPGSDYTLELVQPASITAKIFCKTKVLQPSKYVRVQTGDVTGVSLPKRNPLPLVASDATEFSLMKHTRVNLPGVFNASILTKDLNKALHLYPTIATHRDGRIVSSNSLIPTEVPTLNTSSQTEDDLLLNSPTMNSASQGVGGSKENDCGDGCFISIVLGILNFVIIILVVTGFVAYKIHKASRKGITERENTVITPTVHISSGTAAEVQVPINSSALSIKPNVAYNVINVKDDLDNTQKNIAYEQN